MSPDGGYASALFRALPAEAPAPKIPVQPIAPAPPTLLRQTGAPAVGRSPTMRSFSSLKPAELSPAKLLDQRFAPFEKKSAPLAHGGHASVRGKGDAGDVSKAGDASNAGEASNAGKAGDADDSPATGGLSSAAFRSFLASRSSDGFHTRVDPPRNGGTCRSSPTRWRKRRIGAHRHLAALGTQAGVQIKLLSPRPGRRCQRRNETAPPRR